MSPDVAKTLKLYAIVILPEPAKRKFPHMAPRFQRWLKHLWAHDLNAVERCAFRKLAEVGGPLPESIKQAARSRGFVVEWPPKPKPAPRKRARRGKTRKR